MAKAQAGPLVTIKVKGVKDPRNPKKMIGQPVVENGKLAKPGETLTVTADRAEALKHVTDFVQPAAAQKAA